MRDWLESWSREDAVWLGIIALIVLGLTIGDGLATSIAAESASSAVGRIAGAVHALTNGYWLAAVPILGIAAYRFVALARD